VYRIVDAYLQVAPRDWSAERLASVKALEAIRKNAEKKLEEERVKGTKPSLPTEKYAGTYKDDVFGELRIQWEKDKLVVRLGPIAADLEYWHYDTFRATARDRTQGKMLLTFTLDAKGKIDQVRTRSDDGVEMVLKRAADASQSAPAIVMKEEELRRFAGRYELKTPPVEISLEMLDGKLKASLPGQPVATLVPIKPTRFRVDGAAPDVFVQFDVSDGKVKGLTLEQGSGTTLKLLPKN
jgi:hypothetical protein